MAKNAGKRHPTDGAFFVIGGVIFMKYLHGFFTLLASLVVFVFAGSWLFEKNGFATGLGLFSEMSEADGVAAPYFEWNSVPATGPGKLTAPIFQKGTSLRFRDEYFTLIPVTLGEPAQSWRYGFRGGSSRDERSIARGGSCGDSTVNLLDVDLNEDSGTALFDSRVFIPVYRVYSDPDKQVVVALVVSQDTDDDGFLTCLDDAQIQIIPISEGPRLVISRSFKPRSISEIRFDWDRNLFSFVEQSSIDGGVQLQNVGISLSGEISITEISETRILEGARDAFERTVSP